MVLKALLEDYAIAALIVNAELCVGVLAANLPTYRPLILRMVWNRSVTDTKRSSQVPRFGESVKDSLQISLTSLFLPQNVRSQELGVERRLEPGCHDADLRIERR